MYMYHIPIHTHTHAQMISAERIMAYSQLEPEASLETRPPHPKPPSDWPDEGGLEMEEVSFRYSDNYPLVLKSLSFSIKPSEKVGLLKWVGHCGQASSVGLSLLMVDGASVSGLSGMLVVKECSAWVC